MIMMVNVQGSRLAIDNNEYVVILIALKAGLYRRPKVPISTLPVSC